jgi:hypothetical protein
MRWLPATGLARLVRQGVQAWASLSCRAPLRIRLGDSSAAAGSVTHLRFEGHRQPHRHCRGWRPELLEVADAAHRCARLRQPRRYRHACGRFDLRSSKPAIRRGLQVLAIPACVRDESDDPRSRVSRTPTRLVTRMRPRQRIACVLRCRSSRGLTVIQIYTDWRLSQPSFSRWPRVPSDASFVLGVLELVDDARHAGRACVRNRPTSRSRRCSGRTLLMSSFDRFQRRWVSALSSDEFRRRAVVRACILATRTWHQPECVRSRAKSPVCRRGSRAVSRVAARGHARTR